MNETPAPQQHSLSQHPDLDELIALMARLRGPGGCPWDAEQTHESLVRYLVEETFELVEAIESGSREELVEELGDVLYQVLFHSDIAAHAGEAPFTIDDVAARSMQKMVARHPHVFGDVAAETAADVVLVWDDMKAREKSHRTSVLDGIPQGMPALALADKVLGRAEKLDVPTVAGTGLAGKAFAGETRGEAGLESEEQLGELLLDIVASARSRGLDPERALRAALRGLQARVRAAETAAAR